MVKGITGYYGTNGTCRGEENVRTDLSEQRMPQL